MTGRKGAGGQPRQISELANRIVDPILARRAGIDTLLIGAWEEIAGPAFSDHSRPDGIKWPRQATSAGGAVGGTLTVACSGARAVFLMHETDALLARINAFFGYPAIAAVKIVQKEVATMQRRVRQEPVRLTREEERHLDTLLSGIENDRLRAALARLGGAVINERGRRRT